MHLTVNKMNLINIQKFHISLENIVNIRNVNKLYRFFIGLILCEFHQII